MVGIDQLLALHGGGTPANARGAGVILILIGICVLAILFNSLSTGVAQGLQGGGTQGARERNIVRIYRDEEPGRYWTALAFEIVIVALLFYFGWQNLHR